MKDDRTCTMRHFLLHDNALPHSAAQTQDFITSFKWEQMDHPSYSPDLAPSDFHLFLVIHVIDFYHRSPIWIIIHQRHQMRHKYVSTNSAFIESLSTLKFWATDKVARSTFISKI